MTQQTLRLRVTHAYNRETVIENLTIEELAFLENLNRWFGCYLPHECPNLFQLDDFVYFLQDEQTGLIKIGRSVNPKARLKGIRRECKRAIDLIGLIRVPRRLAQAIDTEGLFHLKFAYYRRQFAPFPKSPEWFGPAAELLNFVGQEAQS